jgi:hypothetical protein
MSEPSAGKKADKQGTLELVLSISKCIAKSDDQRVHELFELAWSKLDAKIQAIQPLDAQDAPKPRPQSEILEELVTAIRDLEQRVNRRASTIDRADLPPDILREFLRRSR